MSQRCGQCGQDFDGDFCPNSQAHGEAKKEIFDFASLFPSPEIAPSDKLEPLRKALLAGIYAEAETEWLKMIRGFRGHSKEEKMKLGAAYEGYAALLEHLGRKEEAKRMQSRAKMARQGPAEPQLKAMRHEATYSFMKEIRHDEGLVSAKAAEVARRVDQQIRSEERRNHALKIAAGLLGGFVLAHLAGLNSLAAVAVGVLAAGALEGRSLISRR
jgi:hypothetical protein